MVFFKSIADKAKATAAKSQKKMADVVSGFQVPTSKVTDDLTKWAESVPDTLHKYASDFKADEMWKKLESWAAKCGQDLVIMVLTMYYTIQKFIPKLNEQKEMNQMGKSNHKKDPEIPWIDVLMFAGAIAYFVMPADFIPDAMPGIGFSDDLSVLTIAFKKAKSIMSSGAFGQAAQNAAEILGDKFDPEQSAKLALKLKKK